MMIVTKQPGESDEAFRRRAFAANRELCVCKNASNDAMCQGLVNCALRAEHPERVKAYVRNRVMSGLDAMHMAEPLRLMRYARIASPMPLRTKAPKVSLRWHVLAVLAVVMTVSVVTWFLS